MSDTNRAVSKSGDEARERILNTAYELFSARGIRAVGTNEIIDRAGVAKATLYSHFPSKNDLVLAFLEQREQRWTHAFVVTEARRRGSTPEEQLLAIFDVFDEWFQREDFEGCSFVNVLLELGAEHPAGAACVRHLETIRGVVRTLAEEAGIADPTEFALLWHILMKGAIVQASQGIVGAGQRAKVLARLLLDQYAAPKRREMVHRKKARKK
jgi:AcrR family transcriptional regulator